MQLKQVCLCLLFFLFSTTINAQESPLWLRYPSISPDGKTIAFSYKGDLYTVPSAGGKATALTIHEANDIQPVWSRDGKRIAFASNRYGNFDIYTISSEGGKPIRLTYFSTHDFPSDFSIDGQHIIFTSARLDDSKNQMFPSGGLPELYKIPASGGRAQQISTVAAQNARYTRDGKRIIYQDIKGYEDQFRKHHISSVTRDLWSFSPETDTYTKITSFNGEDREPVMGPGNDDLYYLSEEKGSFNIFKLSLNNPSPTSQISFLDKHPVRYLSCSNNGFLCFSFNGELYTLREGESPQKVNISIRTDERFNAEKTISVRGNIKEMTVSPSGKEVAYIVRGEIFVSSVKEGTTKRITNTPEQERSIDFSPDGRSLVYAGERDGSWNLYQTSIERKSEKYFFNSTLLKEEVLLSTEAETFEPSYSPDGKEVAFLEERTALKVINLKSKEVREIVPASKNYSYSDGDQYYQWSPDSKWFLVNFLQDKQWISQAGLVSAEGGKDITNLSHSGYGHHSPKWMMDGKMVLYFSSRDGMKNHASWGGQIDVYGLFLDQKAYDEFKLNEEEYELLKEAKKEDEKDEEKDEKGKKKKDEEKKTKALEFELENLNDRRVRLSVHSSSLSDAYVSDDGEKLFYLARFEKGYNLWQTNLRTRETKILAKLNSSSGGSIIPDKKGKNLFILTSGGIKKIKVSDGSVKSISAKGEMILNSQAEREYLFEHAWRQVKKKFYVKNLHNVDWDFYKSEYAKFLPHINNNYDFAEMLSEMLGELNASHTGARYWSSIPNSDQTASLGLFYDNQYTGDGLKIMEVMDKSPVIKDDSKIKAGVIIEKIDGRGILATTNYYSLLNRKSGKNVLLSLYDPSSKKRWEETVKPVSIGREFQLRYERWVKNCEKIVNRLSGGKVGYVHVKGMDDRSYRVVYETVLGKHANKEALIVDTRFNGGGWLHDDLATFLNGKKYMTFMPRGQNIGDEPQFKWRKPSVVVMGEGNYSDAHMFPYTYKALGIGKLVGMPVPGTGTAVWWEGLQNGVVFGIPQVGMVGNDGKYLENTQLDPDIRVPYDPAAFNNAKDPQLEAGVKELLKQLGSN